MQRDDAHLVDTLARFFRGKSVLASSVPILVQMTEPIGKPRAPFQTTLSFGTMVFDRRVGVTAATGPFSIHPLAKRDQNPFASMITVGRAPNNDIVFPYEEISKFHAFFLRTGTGWTLVDAHSTNGTFVTKRRLQAPEPFPLDLSNGSIEIEFSGIQAVLFSPEKLQALVRANELVA